VDGFPVHAFNAERAPKKKARVSGLDKLCSFMGCADTNISQPSVSCVLAVAELSCDQHSVKKPY
jgi:hypothetical protein